jgi:hypothetical protein
MVHGLSVEAMAGELAGSERGRGGWIWPPRRGLDLGKKEEDECVDMRKERGLTTELLIAWTNRPSHKNGPDANNVDFFKKN